jgi:hypothetical protein
MFIMVWRMNRAIIIKGINQMVVSCGAYPIKALISIGLNTIPNNCK